MLIRVVLSVLVSSVLLSTAAANHARLSTLPRRLPWLVLRGGDVEQEELTLDQKVRKAMQKLGISPPPPPPPPVASTSAVAGGATQVNDDGCVDGVCPVPTATGGDSAAATAVLEQVEEPTAKANEPVPMVEQQEKQQQQQQQDPNAMATRIAEELKVDSSLAWAALGATSTAESDDGKRLYNEQAAKKMIQQELDMIAQISEDSEDVKQLVSEGFEPFLVRRALAFVERNVDDARAVLLADKMDEEEAEEEQSQHEQQQQQSDAGFKTVSVDSSFDPSEIGMDSAAKEAATPQETKPANKADVVFDATASQVQELVLESPVPVLLDVYASWCGPCKQLTPILEEMAVRGSGAFRLVKINTDNERVISSALEVTALPTVFAIRDGKVLHMFQGMPRSQEMMQNFMMGLLVSGKFDPAVTAKEQEKYDELSRKLLKTAGASSFSFSARERLQDRMNVRLEELQQQAGVLHAEAAATTIRSLLSNVIRDPFDSRFRTAKLTNKVIEQKIAKYPAAISMLKSAGFVLDSNTQTMTVGKGKKLINVAPLSVVRDSIDKWIDQTRYEVAKAARQQRDEELRLKLQEEKASAQDDDDEEDDDEEEEAEADPNACTLKLRMDGKKQVHEIELQADYPLKAVLKELPVSLDDEEVQITCVAKKLVAKSTDEEIMEKTFRELGLSPSAAIVVSVGAKTTLSNSKTKLSERASSQKRKKKGSHTMQSVGIYAKDDNAKAELIDGGGGVWYEHDVSDDEEKEAPAASEENDEDVGEAADEDSIANQDTGED